MEIGGAGIGIVQFNRDYNGSGGSGLVCLTSNGSGINPSASIIRNLKIQSTAGHTGGSMISIITGSGATDNIGSIGLENIITTTPGTCTQDYGLYVDGTAAATGPKGVRTLNLVNYAAFGAAVASVSIKGVIGFGWHGGFETNGDCTGGPNQAGLVITGTAGVQSYYADVDVTNIGDGLSLSQLNNGRISASVIGSPAGGPNTGISIQTAGSAANVTVASPNVLGTVQPNWTTSQVTK